MPSVILNSQLLFGFTERCVNKPYDQWYLSFNSFLYALRCYWGPRVGVSDEFSSAFS